MDISNSIIEKVRLPVGEDELFYFDVKRDDLIDPIVSGNKWRKLKYNFLLAQQRNNKGLLTYGGPYSNHLIATAKAAEIFGLRSVGIVRGEELHSESNPTLSTCKTMGMHLNFVSRSKYREKDASFFVKQLHDQFPNYLIVPEGGKNYYGVVGCQEILSETENNYHHIYLAGGTGTTAAGILLGTPESTIVNVISALKGSFLQAEIESLLHLVLNNSSDVETYIHRLNVNNDGHFGGYAKVPNTLLEYINKVYDQTKLKLDPIYTAKALYQMELDYINGRIKKSDRVLFIHTGGLQGARTWREKINYFKNS